MAEKKVSKATANYRMSTSVNRRCAICTMFEPRKRECTAVEGSISPDRVCDYFERKGKSNAKKR